MCDNLLNLQTISDHLDSIKRNGLTKERECKFTFCKNQDQNPFNMRPVDKYIKFLTAIKEGLEHYIDEFQRIFENIFVEGKLIDILSDFWISELILPDINFLVTYHNSCGCHHYMMGNIRLELTSGCSYLYSLYRNFEVI